MIHSCMHIFMYKILFVFLLLQQTPKTIKFNRILNQINIPSFLSPFSCLFCFMLILQPIPNADFIVPVEIDGTIHQVYVLKRPYVDEFLRKMGELYECVLFTASLAKYADPVADLLDK